MAILRDRKRVRTYKSVAGTKSVTVRKGQFGQKRKKIFCQKIRQMILKRFFQGMFRDRQEPEALIGQPMRGRGSGESNICNFDLRLIVTKK